MSDTIIVGAGQAGLATAYHMERLGTPATIVAADGRVGDSWRHRWDSLELFTPAFINSLPGMPFPADDPQHFPTGDEMADYLEAYAHRLQSDIRLGTRVETVELAHGNGTDGAPRFLLHTDAGPLRCANLVVAAGAYRTPRIPPFADQLDPDTTQLHSSGYRNPDALPAGDVLVVGAGNSGTQIATELARTRPRRQIWLSGPDTGRFPRRLLGRDVFRWLGPTLFRARRDSLLGRLIHAKARAGGDPVFRDQYRAMVEAGVRRVPRTTGARDGRPVLRDRGPIDVSSVIWATGYDNDFGWLGVPGALDPDGKPRHNRGVSPIPGLFFMGLPRLYRLDSALVAGVGDDAAHVARRIREFSTADRG